MTIKKKAQEEMVGFILIVVLVSIIAVVFLFIVLRKPVEVRQSSEVSDFLYSSLIYTTDCKPSQEQVYEFKDIVKACLNKEKCISGEDTCDILNKTASEMIEAGFGITPEAKYKAYDFKIFTGNETGNQTLLYLQKGNITSNIVGSEAFFMSGDSFHLKLRLYY